MAPGDLMLTPHGCWHDHKNLSDQSSIWLDVLDASFLNHLNALFFEGHNSTTQTLVRPEGWGRRMSGPLRPPGVTAPRTGHRYRYKGSETLARLAELPSEDADPFEGVTLEFVNPLNGGPTTPTIQRHLHRLASGRVTRAHRHTWNAVCHVVSGSGETLAAGKTLRRGPHDNFVIPSWSQHEHQATGTGDAVLFCATEQPILRAFALDRMEAGG
jgi:gentisate 1,2-dioxygenase